MNKILKNIVGGLVLLVILVAFYLLTFQMSEKKLVIKETTYIVSVGDLGSKKMKNYYDLYEKASKVESKEVKQYTKYIKGIDFISFNTGSVEAPEKDKNILAVNVGWLYPIAKFKKDEYFDNLGKNYFSLKEEYQNELKEKYGIEEKIYMTNYKGYFFISDDVMKLSDYLRLLVKKETNKNITSKLTGETLGEVIIDVNHLDEGVSALKLDLDYKEKELTLNGYLYGDMEFSKYFEGIDPKSRKLEKYMGKDKIYLTNKDFKGLTEFVRERIDPNIDSALSLVKMFTGKELEDYMEKIDGEIIYDYMSDQLVVPVKETKDFENLLKVFSKIEDGNYVLSNGKSVVIEDNIIYYNGKMLEGDIAPTKDEFINGSLNIGIYDPRLLDIYVNVGGKVFKDKIKIRATIKEDELIEIYKRLEAN